MSQSPQNELAWTRSEVQRLRAEIVRLEALLRLNPAESGPAGPGQTAVAVPRVGLVAAGSPPSDKIALFLDLFGARTDVFARRWENQRLGTSGWMPAVEGGWRKGMDRRTARHLPLTVDVVAAHLLGDLALGLYPLLPEGTCHWLAADFDGAAALLDALAYMKAARARGVPVSLEISRSGRGAHAWIFFSDAVPASGARRLGLGLLRHAMTIRGRMSLASYDRLFPSQDVLPEGGFGNLIAAPLQGRSRRSGTTVFLDLASMEPHDDQWAFLSAVDRLAPRSLAKALGGLGEQAVGTAVRGMDRTDASRIRERAPDMVGVTLTRRFHAEPGVRRAPEAKALHLGRAEIPSVPQRDAGGRSGASPGPVRPRRLFGA